MIDKQQAIDAVRAAYSLADIDRAFNRGIDEAVARLRALPEAPAANVVDSEARDSIVMAAKAQRAYCIDLIRRAKQYEDTGRGLPLTAQECIQILEAAPLADDLSVPRRPARGRRHRRLRGRR